MKHRLTLCVSSVLFILSIQCSLGVVFYSTPQDLDDVKDNSSVIVAGSVIQLFCSASGQFTAPHIQWTRDDITIPETVQLPYLMVKSRTQNNFTSSTLIIGGFSETDNGCYSCLAQETGGSSAISAPLLLTGSLQIAAAPSIQWLKDGAQLYGDGVRVVINTSISIVATSNRTVSFVCIFNFSQSDAGVYQCVFYDTPSQGGEVVTTRPYKVDTGPIRLTTSFPSTITFSPPGSLVIQVEAGGEYADLASTTVAPDTIVTKLGMSVDILCTSSGYPVPTVSWYYQPDDQSSLYGPLPPSVAVGSPIQVCNGVCSCNVNSSLYICNASRSIHQGIYLCVGVSIINGNTLLSNASVNLVVMSGRF
eukprot:Em0004g1278a